MKGLLWVALVLTLSACTTTRTVLLPDEDGKVGALVLRHGDHEQVLDQAYAEAKVGLLGGVSSQQVSREVVERKFGESLAAEPVRPASFILYFQEGGVELTEASSALLPGVIEAYKGHAPAKVFIIGHTDRAGSAELNQRLGLERAQVVERMLRDTDSSFESMEVRSFGESDPLVPTADEVDEPRNRRVEVLIL